MKQAEIHATHIKRGAVSMLHMHHIITTPRDTDVTPAMRWGTLLHASILQPDEFRARARVWDGDKRGNAWRDFSAGAAAEGAWALSGDEAGRLAALTAAVRAHPAAHALLSGGAAEVPIVWRTPEYGPAGGRMDYFCGGKIVDVKSTSAIDARTFARRAIAGGMDLQMGWYAEGVSILGMGYTSAHIIAVEAGPPYDVAVYDLPPAMVSQGRARAVSIARAYRDCEAAGIYPGQAPGAAVELDVPAWYYCGDQAAIPESEEIVF